MKEFEVKVQRNPQAPVKPWMIKAKDAATARAAAEHMLKLSGAKTAKVISIKEKP